MPTDNFEILLFRGGGGGGGGGGGFLHLPSILKSKPGTAIKFFFQYLSESYYWKLDSI